MDYFVDLISGSNANTGKSMSVSWKTVEYAMEFATLAAGDYIFVRRGYYTGENLINPVSLGRTYSPIHIMSWPRPEESGVAYFQNNSRYVTASSIQLSNLGYCSRYIKGPDNNQYIATIIPNTSSLYLNTEYIGPTTYSSYSFYKDEYYDYAQTIPVGAADKKSLWNSDTSSVAQLDFSNGLKQIEFRDDNCWEMSNMALINSSHSLGALRCRDSFKTWWNGILIDQSSGSNKDCITGQLMGHVYIKRCVLKGKPSYDGLQSLINLAMIGELYVSDTIFLETGLYDLTLGNGGNSLFENCNFSLDSSGSNILYTSLNPVSSYPNDGIKFVNCKWSSSLDHKLIWTASSRINRICYENMDREIGQDMVLFQGAPLHGYMKRNFGTQSWLSYGNVALRSGGSDSVLEFKFDGNSTSYRGGCIAPVSYSSFNYGLDIINHQFYLPSGDYNLKYYCQFSSSNITASDEDDLWLEVKHIKTYASSNNYIYNVARSSGSIISRSNIGDWSRYLEINFSIPSQSSFSRVESSIYYGGNSSATKFYFLDPKPELTKL